MDEWFASTAAAFAHVIQEKSLGVEELLRAYLARDAAQGAARLRRLRDDRSNLHHAHGGCSVRRHSARYGQRRDAAWYDPVWGRRLETVCCRADVGNPL